MSPFMNRTDRLYAIVEQLRHNGRRGRTADWLAQHLEVSPRTIKRDIAALQAAGTPIAGQDGRGGGYQLATETLAPVALTSAEVGAIAVAVGSDPHLPFAPDGRTALTKLLRTMSASQREEIARITSAVWVRSGGPRGASRSCIRIVDEAIRRGVAITINYEDGARRITETRRIDPLAVARTGGRWYVLAWCHVRLAGRWFRFDRIRRATLTRTPVVRRDLVKVFGAPPADAQPVSSRLGREPQYRTTASQSRF
jgi:predicted DNA-binding transcriptional regulator YafY